MHYDVIRRTRWSIVQRPLVSGMLTLMFFAINAAPGFGLISIADLTKDQAGRKHGITMHARRNGEKGVKVWLQFRQEGSLKNFTYAELQMTDDRGKHLVSARLQPSPVHHQQAPEMTTVSFAVEPAQLEHCSFLVVCYDGLSGVGYSLKLRDFLDPQDPYTEQ